MPDDEFEQVRVNLEARSYDVLIGRSLLHQADRLIGRALGTKSRAFVVTDTNVALHHLTQVEEALRRSGLLRGSVALPPGETTKCFKQLEKLCDAMLASGVERGDYVIALGGGVIGDLAGFAAAIVRRGIRYVQVPTSLLAQVDSSVGGKTAINSSHGKNLIGSFHQPQLVLIDTDVLSSLPMRQMRAGYAEIVKHGLLGDRSYYDWLDAHVEAVLGKDPGAMRRAIRRSVEIKAEIVGRDETEQGDRALLNLGHTFGHALEAWTGYSDRLLHGEGVAIGVCLAFRLSEHLNLCPPQTAAGIAAHIKRSGLPTRIQDIDGSALPDAALLVTHMEQDKKVRDGQLTFILARDVGDAFVSRDISREQVTAFLRGEIEEQ